MLNSKCFRSSTKLLITTLAITSIAICDAFLHTSYYERRRKVPGLRRKCSTSDVYNAVEDTTAISSPLQTNSCIQYVAKTTESFKLADLYWLQANVMAYCQNNSQSALVQKLSFHRPTASLLLGYDGISNSSSELPFPADRVQYVGVVVASGATTQDLLDSIKERISPSLSGSSTTNDCNPSWTLDCDTFEPLTGRQFTKSMLMCAVSRHLSGEPVLEQNDIDDETISYLLLETSSKLYLIEKPPIQNQMHDKYQENVSHFRQEWSRRPFQYSGAVNIDIAITVVDMLRRLLSKNGDDLQDNKRIRLLDPTVGSGTFLAAAAKLWNMNDGQNESLDIVGVDSNSKCSEGASKNLCKLLNVDRSTVEEDPEAKSWTFSYTDSKNKMPSRATIYCGDSVELLSNASLDGAFDCVVSNLPWNRNTFEYKQETIGCASSEILKQIAEVIKPGKPAIIVSGSNDPVDSFNAKRTLHSFGFHIIGEVTIPPAGFSLPESGKKKKSIGAPDRSTKRNSNCVVTVAIAPC